MTNDAGPPRRITTALIKRGLEDVAAGHQTLAGLSRSWGRDSSYLQARARKDPGLRQQMDLALIDRADRLAEKATQTGAIGMERVIDHFVLVEEENRAHRAKGEPEELIPAGDLDKLARALTAFQDVLDRSAAAARERERERASAGVDPVLVARQIRELFIGPAAALPAIGGTS